MMSESEPLFVGEEEREGEEEKRFRARMEMG